MGKGRSATDLAREVKDFRERFRNLEDDQLFVIWFLRAFVTENETQAADALCGGSGDKNIDAILVDDPAKVVFVVQRKYRKSLSAKNEKPNDVRSFAELAQVIGADSSDYGAWCKNLAADTEHRLSSARKRLLEGYRLQMYYVTLGRCSASLREEANRIAGRGKINTSVEIIDGRQILRLLEDYLNGVAPPVPSLDLEMECGNGVEVMGILQRHDAATDIESWVFPMAGSAIADVVERAGRRLFARNIRGFLGTTSVNKEIETTLQSQPEYFWYYNNGITIVCDNAEEVRGHGRKVLRVRNPQIINGQQTARTLHRHGGKSSKASALVRVIRVPRDVDSDSDEFDTLVSRIVTATNWQNKIVASDLQANDRKQIALERELRKLGYWYIRKRQTKGEAKRLASSQRYIMLRKEELAQAVAGCDLDPAVPRTQKDALFEERIYSKVFAATDPNYYLTRYRLLREVNYHAKGSKDRANAKWLVLHVVWQRLGASVRARAAAEQFRNAGSYARPIVMLSKAITEAFEAVKRFYKANKSTVVRANREGSGAVQDSWHRKESIDVPTFFKRRGLVPQFESFWKSSRAKEKFDSAMGRFEAALREEISG